jgi:hypothetical protein
MLVDQDKRQTAYRENEFVVNYYKDAVIYGKAGEISVCWKVTPLG